MYCQTCGSALPQHTKYCNRCGTQLEPSNEKDYKTPAEKRLDEYLDGLFWITAFGVGLTAGGLLVLKKADFSERFLLAFLILSATAFLVNFALSLWVVSGVSKTLKEAKTHALPSPADTSELEPMKIQPALQPAASVTENTTRSFEPIYNKRNSE